MPSFTVNPTRFDPYKNFKFRLKWDGRYVASNGVTRSTTASHGQHRNAPLHRSWVADLQTQFIVVGRGGIEPPTFRFSGGRSTD